MPGMQQETRNVTRLNAVEAPYDVVAFGHIRWDFVFQRPQHLLVRYAERGHRVWFVEDPVPDSGLPRLEFHARQAGVTVVVPHLPEGASRASQLQLQRRLLAGLLRERGISRFVLWFYNPMAIPLALAWAPLATVYDCMDELSLFKNPPPDLLEHELALFRRADVVFTGGQSLYEHKRDRHHNIHAFPSSIELSHFLRARKPLAAGEEAPQDQRAIPLPRIGYYGVIDERMDTTLLAEVARQRPAWQLVLVGPLAKVSSEELPHAPNIRYLGPKRYDELPRYLRGWDVAMLPFARNDSTRFISPTKTPEYLAAGRPVVSTSIRDVVSPYGTMDLVHIADTPADFIAAIEAILRADAEDRQSWLERADLLLAGCSWDRTWEKMHELTSQAIATRRRAAMALEYVLSAGVNLPRAAGE